VPLLLGIIVEVAGDRVQVSAAGFLSSGNRTMLVVSGLLLPHTSTGV